MIQDRVQRRFITTGLDLGNADSADWFPAKKAFTLFLGKSIEQFPGIITVTFG